MTQGGNAVAVIGMGGRFPDASNLNGFWSNLKNGVESIRELTDDELGAAGIPAQVYQQPNYVRAATVLDGIDQFDAEFFGYAPREAEIMDPQQRLFLEAAWQAMEDSGYVPGDRSMAVGVFGSVTMNSYTQSVIYRNPEVAGGAGGYQLMLGNDKDFLSTRVSYKLDLRGPSLTVQTACSSSLVAVEMATQSLLRNQCDMALVGGASVTIPQETGYLFQEGMIFSPDGHCRPFDAKGGGIRAGHGAGVVALKRMADAVADGDRIRAVILGAAINNDGAGKIGYTAPSVEGQAEVIAMAQALAGIEPESIGYVETHGTGTKLGDPIEVAALSQVFKAGTDKKQYCGIGSLKSNLGHLDAAAGIASLIKTVLSLENKQIPPSLNFSEPNPEIDFASGPFFVNDTLRDWPSLGGPPRAGVSSFGIGGTNAHVVLEAGPDRPNTPVGEPRDQIFLISAKTQDALGDTTENLGDFLSEQSDLELADVAFTSQVGRYPFPFRRMFVAGSGEEAMDILRGESSNRLLNGTASETPGPVAFMFSGQGGQHPGMGKELYHRFRAFREAFDVCAEIVQPDLGTDIREVVFGADRDGDTANLLQQTWLTQPSLFAVEYSLAKLWMSWGLVPDSMIGHSIGEWVAAHLSGVFSLEDSLGLVTYRGRLMHDQPAGTMFSVSLPEQEVRALLGDMACVAAINSPSLCTVSGTEESMAQLAEVFGARDVPFRRLHTSHAFHSEMMDPVVTPFQDRVAQTDRNSPRVPFVSNVTGSWITEDEAMDPGYWAGQIRSPVRFLDGIRELAAKSDRFLLELGPGQALTTFARQCVDLGSVGRVVATLPHAKDETPSDRFALEALGRLWLSGGQPDWNAIHDGEKRRRTGLPTYPFQRKRYWVEPASIDQGSHADSGRAPDLTNWFYAPSWARTSILETSVSDSDAISGPWLILDSGSEIGARIGKRLEDLNADVVTVSSGVEYSRGGDDEFSIDPAQPDHYDRLFADLKEDDRLPHRIVHLWTGPGSPDLVDSRDLAMVEKNQTYGFYSLVFLSQTLGRLGATHPVRLTVFTRGMTSVIDDKEVTHPENASLFGPCAVLPFEAPWIDCRLVDLPAEPSELSGHIPSVLVREAMLERPTNLVAYRKGHRWEQFYEGLPVGEARTDAVKKNTEGTPVYLITGGLGGLGRVFARYLAERGPCVLALIGRSQLPPPEEWDRHLADDPTSKTAGVIQDLQQLSSMGATVSTLSADVTNEAQMSVALREISEAHGPISGVIHAAGVPATGILQLKTQEVARSVLGPKIRGALILSSLLGNGPLEFFVLFSSINSILAAPGGADYCAANAFLDSFARYRRANGDPSVVSINWDTWQEVGMAVDTEVPPELQSAKEVSLAMGITSLEGLEAYGRCLGTDLPQVVISPQNVPTILAIHAAAKLQARMTATSAPLGDAQSMSGVASSSKHQRPDLPQTYVPPRTDMEGLVAHIWQELLGIEPVGIHDNFFELGGHSLLAIRVLAHLQETTEVSLPLEAIFEAPTVAGISERIETLQWMAGDGTDDDADQSEREEFII